MALLLSDPEGAAALAQAALQQAQAAGNPAAACFAHLHLAQTGLREAAFERGALHWHAAEALLPQHRHPRVHQLAEHVRAQWLRRTGRGPEALALLQALHARAAGRVPLDAFYTATLLGIGQGIAGRHDDALVSFYDALALAGRCGQLSIEVNALNNLGSYQLDLYNLEDATQLLERCLAGALALGSRRQIIFAAGNLVQCHCAMGRAPDALEVARSHLVALIQPGDGPTLQRDEEIAHALIENGLWDEAEVYLARTPQHDAQTNETTACRAWLEARVQLVRGDPAAALACCLRQQQREGEDTNMPLDLLRLAEAAAAAAAACDDHRTAYAQMVRASAIRSDLLGRAAQARFASLKIQHELQRMLQERDAARQLALRLEQLNGELRAQVAANETLQQRLLAQALEDPLTGLHNRRHLFKAGPALLQQARRLGSGVAAAMIDLDHFKQINDRHGHDRGDQVLKAFAGLLRAAVRASDVCCRYGGEEFVVVFALADAATAQRRVGELLQALGALRFEGAAGTDFGCTFSAGIAASAPGGEALEDLLKRADAALYEAKRGGRNRVELAALA